MAEVQTKQAPNETATVEAGEFTQLLQKEFKPKTADAKTAVQQAVHTLASQALANTAADR